MMNLQELQKKIDSLQKRNNWINSPDETMVFLLEELGEIAKWVRKSRKSKLTGQEKEELGYEFADVLQHLMSLANAYEIDVRNSLQKKKGI